ncbi:MAG: tryptophan-rich sensory protein [Candidatus Brocadiae bacterium]|nr:tryptophan-rich sensory protein [Candidatus Brocadiia bacterium]
MKPFFTFLFKLILFIAIPLLIGSSSSYFAKDSMSQYKELIKPSFSPPGWIFGIMWTILYILMGIASFRIYISHAETKTKRAALAYYAAQLGVNFFWTIIFFHLQLRGLALLWLILLWALILLTMQKFYKIDKLSASLLLPYILWVSFAGILNYEIWFLNKN